LVQWSLGGSRCKANEAIIAFFPKSADPTTVRHSLKSVHFFQPFSGLSAKSLENETKITSGFGQFERFAKLGHEVMLLAWRRESDQAVLSQIRKFFDNQSWHG